MLQIRNKKTEETEALHRDVCHRHPAWVHVQIGTSSESELQGFLDSCSFNMFAENAGVEDSCGVFMSNEDAEKYLDGVNRYPKSRPFLDCKGGWDRDPDCTCLECQQMLAEEEGEVLYMNVATGSVAGRDGWWYETEEGQTVNAVDRGEVVPVVWSEDDESWIEE